MKTLIWFLMFLFSSISIALPAGWKEVRPGGNTLCAHGEPFAFLIYPGDPQKIVVDFAGGGACWDSLTCDTDQIYTDKAEDSYKAVDGQEGIYNLKDTRNPYYGWTRVLIPYCTADVHIGNNDAKYFHLDGSSFTIHHRGAVNTQAVLDWLKFNYNNPTDMVISGCSAGAYGSIVWTPHFIEENKQARFLQFADSGAGVTRSMFYESWGMQGSLAAWIPGLNPAQIDWHNFDITSVYHATTSYYPQTHFSQFNHDKDRVQIFFYILSSGTDGKDWSPRMYKNMEDAAVSSNFHYYVAPGRNHCSETNASFYTTKSDGVLLQDWLSDAVNNRNFQNVKCLQCKSGVK